MKTLALIAWLFVLSFPVFGQIEISFNHITTKHGLSEGSVHTILQDRRGFLWFGTQDGLNRYDGYTFAIYRQGSPRQALSDNFIYTLCEDTANGIWIGTFNQGLCRFDRMRESFTIYKHDSTDATSLGDNTIRALYRDRKGILWIGTFRGGLDQMTADGKFKHYRHNPHDPAGLSSDNVWALYEDSRGNFWVGTDGGGLNLLDPMTGKCTVFKNEPGNIRSLSHNTVRAIYEDRAGVLWVATSGGGLNRFDYVTRTFTTFKNHRNDPQSLSHDFVRALYEDKRGNFWVGTLNGGLNLMDRVTGKFIRFLPDVTDPGSIIHKSVISIVEDRSGTVWFGTWGGGVSYISPTGHRFINYRYDPFNSYSLSQDRIYALHEDQSRTIWVGTFGGGLNRYLPDQKKFLHFKKSKHGLSHDDIWSIAEDQNGDLWIGTNEGGLNRWDRKRGTFEIFRNDPHDANSLSNDNVFTVYVDPLNTVWIGTSGGGLNRFDRNARTFRRFTHDPALGYTVSSNQIRALHQDKEGLLWVGTFGGGISVWDRKKEIFTRHLSSNYDSSSLSSDLVLRIFESRDGLIWIGTAGGGLNRYDKQTGHWKTYTDKHGLANNVINGILEDQTGRLWISTNKGLSRLDPKTETFRNFDEGDGLISAEFGVGAALRAHDGRMYFGSNRGLVTFHPDSIKENRYVPPVIIAGFKKFNKPFVLERSVSETDTIIISYKDNFIAFEFAALNYTHSEKNLYRYKLEGFDRDWIDAGSRREATYTNLDGGTYVFRVKASNNDNVWNEEGRAITLIVEPPFWETVWFQFLVGAFLCAVLVYRFRQIQNQKRELERQVQVRTHELEKAMDSLKRAQVQILQSEKIGSLAHMVAGIAHEINNPLTFVYSNIQLLRARVQRLFLFMGFLDKRSHTESWTDDEKKQYEKFKHTLDYDYLEKDLDDMFRSSVEGSTRIIKIVNSLRAFSSLDQEEIQETNLLESLNMVVDLFMRQHKDIVIERKTTEIPFITVHLTLMHQAFINILDNSVKAIRDAEKQNLLASGDGRITLSAEWQSDKNKIRLCFIDNGVGIDSSVRNKIFDPFFTTRPIGAGAGLGLSEVFTTVRKHGGDVTVESEPGIGTTLCIDLPVKTLFHENYQHGS
ncbi:MAG TPA: two-component regulator propeller domain-containing protein [bacterium]|nr:two-component regulator propeller domain-containing protein [bacterium]